MSSSAHLRCEGLVVRLAEREVLRGIDAAFFGGWTAIIGPNGAGKSTLLRALAGLAPAAAGRVILDDRPLAAVPRAERGRRIAWLAQQGATSGDLTVRETVELGRLPHLGLVATSGPADRSAVDHAMAATECGVWEGRRLHALSGGERQRVLLARALATEAPVLLLDEPTTHLDAPHQVALARLFRRLAREPGRTLVTVLHDLPIALHADRLLLLEEGRVAATGPPADRVLQEALARVFRHAVRVGADARGRPRIDLALDDV